MSDIPAHLIISSCGNVMWPEGTPVPCRDKFTHVLIVHCFVISLKILNTALKGGTLLRYCSTADFLPNAVENEERRE